MCSAARVKTGGMLGIAKEKNIINTYPASQALNVRTAIIVTPINVAAVNQRHKDRGKETLRDLKIAVDLVEVFRR